MLWDRGTWEPVGDPRQGLTKGKFVFKLHGEKLHGEWTLVKTFGKDKRGNSWLLIKHKDEEIRKGDNAQFLEENATSVVSGRTMDEIAGDSDKVWRSNREQTLKTLPAKKPEPAPRHYAPNPVTLPQCLASLLRTGHAQYQHAQRGGMGARTQIRWLPDDFPYQ